MTHPQRAPREREVMGYARAPSDRRSRHSVVSRAAQRQSSGMDQARALGEDPLVEIFMDDDDGYLRWLAANPEGFVLNTYRNPRPSYLRLHTSTCRSIVGTPANGSSWTVTYVKRCGSRKELEDFASREVGGEAWVCPTCLG
jgi:hypothetical protein